MQVRAALTKIWKYGPDFIENWVREVQREIGFKLPVALPSFYWEAKDLYLVGVKPWDEEVTR